MAHIKILAFDPGIQHLGYSISLYDMTTHRLEVIRYGVIHGEKLLRKQKEFTEKYGRRFVILTTMEAIIAELMNETMPDEIVLEGAFQARFPDAFAALSLVIHVIRRAAHLICGLFCHTVAPKESKVAISGDGEATKDDVIAAIINHPNIVIREDASVEPLVEHSADTIAGCWAFVRKHIRGEILATPKKKKK